MRQPPEDKTVMIVSHIAFWLRTIFAAEFWNPWIFASVSLQFIVLTLFFVFLLPCAPSNFSESTCLIFYFYKPSGNHLNQAAEVPQTIFVTFWLSSWFSFWRFRVQHQSPVKLGLKLIRALSNIKLQETQADNDLLPTTACREAYGEIMSAPESQSAGRLHL